MLQVVCVWGVLAGLSQNYHHCRGKISNGIGGMGWVGCGGVGWVGYGVVGWVMGSFLPNESREVSCVCKNMWVYCGSVCVSGRTRTDEVMQGSECRRLRLRSKSGE